MNARQIAKTIELKSLKPGVSITQRECEILLRPTGFRNEHEYHFQLMILCKEVERLLKQSGAIYTIRAIKGSLCVLTDSEASKFNASSFQLAQSKMRRSHRRLMAVQTSRLTADEQALHEQNISRQAIILSSMRQRINPSELATAATRTVPSIRR